MEGMRRGGAQLGFDGAELCLGSDGAEPYFRSVWLRAVEAMTLPLIKADFPFPSWTLWTLASLCSGEVLKST